MHIQVEEVRNKALGFQKAITRRNLREFIASVFVIVVFTYQFAMVHDVVARIAFGMIIAATVYVMWQLLTRGAAAVAPADMGRVSCLAFYRLELERQRDLLRNVWRWYFGPFIPGVALITVQSVISGPAKKAWFAVLFGVFAALLFWWIGERNRRGAARLDRQIQEIRKMENGND